MDLFKNKKIIYFIIVFLGMIIIGIVAYFKVFKAPDSEETSLSATSTKSISSFLDVRVLKTSFFESLVRYGEYPIEARFPGRNNPFEPYQ